MQQGKIRPAPSYGSRKPDMQALKNGTARTE